MNFVGVLLLLIASTGFLLLVLGLVKPWIVLWWEDTQNRKKVLLVYGTVILASLLAYVLLLF